MERVVITGMGINSCIGNTLEKVTESLKAGRSGIRYNEVYAKLNFRSHVSATAEMNFENIDPELKNTWAFAPCMPTTRHSMRYNMPSLM